VTSRKLTPWPATRKLRVDREEDANHRQARCRAKFNPNTKTYLPLTSTGPDRLVTAIAVIRVSCVIGEHRTLECSAVWGRGKIFSQIRHCRSTAPRTRNTLPVLSVGEDSALLIRCLFLCSYSSSKRLFFLKAGCTSVVRVVRANLCARRKVELRPNRPDNVGLRRDALVKVEQVLSGTLVEKRATSWNRFVRFVVNVASQLQLLPKRFVPACMIYKTGTRLALAD